jgi:AMP nucleosidase
MSAVAYRYEVPIGTIMLVSDMPLQRRGIKDKRRHNQIYADFMESHLDLGIDAVVNLQKNWEEVEKRLHSEW